MNVLILTSVLPAPIASKKRENDVLLKTANYHESLFPNVRHHFVFVIPYSNFLFSLISKRWSDFRKLRKQRHFHLAGRKIEVIAVPSFRKDSALKSFFIRLAFEFNKRRLKRLIQLNNIDLVHAHNIGSDLGIARRINECFGLPYVVTTRDIHRSHITKFIRSSLSNARALISLNHQIKAVSDLYNQHSYILPHGIDGEFLDQNTYKKAHDSKAIRIVTVCRLLDWKNIDKILLVLNDVDFDFTYHIYGDGPDCTRLRGVLSNLKIKDKVDFKGFIPYEKIPCLLQQYDLFALISFPETFGRIYIEAMATGLPIVCAKGCGMDGFIENKIHGFTVDHRSREELLEALNILANDVILRQRIGNNAKMLATDFAWDSIIHRLDEIYKKSLSN